MSNKDEVLGRLGIGPCMGIIFINRGPFLGALFMILIFRT